MPIQPGLFGRRPQINFTAQAQLLGMTLFAGWQSDCGVMPGTGLAGLADQSGNANDLGNITGTNQPAYAQDPTINGMPAISFDGSNDWLTSVLDLPAPPLAIYSVFRQDTWTAGHILWAAGIGDSYALSPNTSSPQLLTFNGTLGPLSSGAPVGSWCRGVQRFTNSTSDSLKLGSAAPVSGVNLGNSNPTAGWVWGKNGSSATFSRMSIVLQLIISGALSNQNQAILDGLVTMVYGPGVLL